VIVIRRACAACRLVEVMACRNSQSDTSPKESAVTQPKGRPMDRRADRWRRSKRRLERARCTVCLKYRLHGIAALGSPALGAVDGTTFVPGNAHTIRPLEGSDAAAYGHGLAIGSSYYNDAPAYPWLIC
jgi:hypothetical protein